MRRREEEKTGEREQEGEKGGRKWREEDQRGGGRRREEEQRGKGEEGNSIVCNL